MPDSSVFVLVVCDKTSIFLKLIFNKVHKTSFLPGVLITA